MRTGSEVLLKVSCEICTARSDPAPRHSSILAALRTLPDDAVNGLDALLRVLRPPKGDVRAATGPVLCATYAGRHRAVDRHLHVERRRITLAADCCTANAASMCCILLLAIENSTKERSCSKDSGLPHCHMFTLDSTRGKNS